MIDSCLGIQIAVGIELESGNPAKMFLHDDGLIIPPVTVGDCLSLVAILRDAADAIEAHQSSIAN